MRFQVVTTPDWAERIASFDAQLDPHWICDVTAVRASNQSGPRREAVALYLRRKRSIVIVALDDHDELVGYLVGDDDTDGRVRGGGRGRWISASSPAVIQGLVEVLADRYGWAWGRITNPLIAAALADFGCATLPDDPTIFTYRRP